MKKAALLIIASTGLAVSLLVFAYPDRSEVKAASENPMQSTTVQKVSSLHVGLPVRLRIPSIRVDAGIESLGLTSKGAMDVPNNPDVVSWYNRGSRPGEEGSAVIGGHLDWFNGRNAVFEDLNTLQKGDIVTVETDTGKFLRFVVRDIRSYDPGEYVPEVFRGGIGTHLNLVTCGGVWDTARKIYSERLVVFTDLVER